MSLEAITEIREVEERTERAKAEARAQAQKLAADAERDGKALLRQGGALSCPRKRRLLAFVV